MRIRILSDAMLEGEIRVSGLSLYYLFGGKKKNEDYFGANVSFNIGEGWNPICCHGNEAVELKLWSTFSGILLQRIKHF